MDNFIDIYQGNPTAGAQDGTKVSSGGTFTSPISFNLDAEQNETAIIKLAVRTAAGYKTKGTTTIADRDDVDDHLKLCKTENGEFTDSITFDEEITAANKIFYAKAISRDSEYPTLDRAACFTIKAGKARA